VQHEEQEEPDFRRDEQRIFDERVGVVVERVTAGEQQQIAGQMSDQKADERQPRQRDQNLAAH
jgi:hypothetical protein